MQRLGLTAREREILIWVSRGKTNRRLRRSFGSRPARSGSTSRTSTRSSACRIALARWGSSYRGVALAAPVDHDVRDEGTSGAICPSSC
jgi:hypothetical protein